MTELDAWEALQEGHWPETSFDEVVDSPWVARMQGTVAVAIRHFVFQTYDEVFEILCTTYQLELGDTSD